jgi:hypothetical protein
MHGCVPEREIDRQKERGFRRIYKQYNIIYTFCIIHPPPKKNIDTHYQKKNTHNQQKTITEYHRTHRHYVRSHEPVAT